LSLNLGLGLGPLGLGLDCLGLYLDLVPQLFGHLDLTGGNSGGCVNISYSGYEYCEKHINWFSISISILVWILV
jgi:hypothetical protein